jgi:hypothetical protein
MTDRRMNPDLIHDVLDVLNRHGYARADNEHTGRAIVLISDLAHIYEGAQDHPFGPYINETSPDRTEPALPEPAAHDAVNIPADQGQNPPGVAGHRRRRRTRPRRGLLRMHQPVLPHLPVASPARPNLRPRGRSPDPGHRGHGHYNRERPQARPPAHSRPGSRPVTSHRTAPTHPVMP